MSTPLIDQVKDVAADVFEVPARALDAASSPSTVETWDSVRHLSLVLALEQRFEISLEPEDIEKMTTLEAAAAVVGSKLARS